MNQPKSLQAPRVTVITVTYGNRWKFLSQVISAVMKDPHVIKFVIVDNGSKNKEEITAGVEEYGEKVVVLRQEKNLGSAGGFATGLSYVQKIDCDFVFILDDDNVPEEGAISKFLEIKKFFPDEKVVLVGNRININSEQNFFYNPPSKNESYKKLVFSVFNFSSFISYFRCQFFLKKKWQKRFPFTPIVPIVGFAYGGSFIPIEAVRKAPLPDASLVLYGDDTLYSIGISRIGYNIYLCVRPYIYDIDLSLGDNKKLNSRIPTSFDPFVPSFRIYFSIRNMVRVSIRHTYKANPVLLLRIIIWTLALCAKGMVSGGYTKIYWKRVRLILRAVVDGYNLDTRAPEYVILP